MENTRAAALLAGTTLYDNGKPCPHGHASVRYASNMACVECTRERNANAAGTTVGARQLSAERKAGWVVSKQRMLCALHAEFTDCVVAVTQARHPWATRADVVGRGVVTNAGGGRALYHYHIDAADHVTLFDLAGAMMAPADEAILARTRAENAARLGAVEQEANAARDNGETEWAFA
jgi:hypothetical protein